MAGDWIKMRTDIGNDPAVYRISAITKLDRFSVIGRLYKFWAWADKYAVDGRVDGGTTQAVDDIVSHDGFSAAMVEVRWLEVGDDFIGIPNHDRHNGESAKERSLKNQRQARWRSGKGDAPVDEPVDASPSTKTSTRRSTKASTREEKRREEKEHPAGFVSFWSTWPASERKEAKGKCAEAWVKGNLEDIKDAILSHVEAKKQSPGWTKDGGQYIPAPLVYLNGRKWDGAEETGQVSLLSQFASRRVGA